MDSLFLVGLRCTICIPLLDNDLNSVLWGIQSLGHILGLYSSPQLYPWRVFLGVHDAVCLVMSSNKPLWPKKTPAQCNIPNLHDTGLTLICGLIFAFNWWSERDQSSSNDRHCSSSLIHPLWHWIKRCTAAHTDCIFPSTNRCTDSQLYCPGHCFSSGCHAQVPLTCA